MRRQLLKINDFFPRLLSYLYPSLCPVCGDQTDTVAEAPFCKKCWSGMERYAGPACRICALPLDSEYGQVCGECLKKPPSYSKAISFGIYEDSLSAAINQFKFQGVKRLYKPLGKLLLKCAVPEADAVVPVPLSIGSLRKRGFNQSLLLAYLFSNESGISLEMDGLWKVRETRPQVGLSAKERASNLRGAYRADGNFNGKRLILIDDVMTTGATSNECSRQLLRAGAKEVIVLTLARARAC